MPRRICPPGLRAWLAAAALLVLFPWAAVAAPAGTVVGLFGGCFIESGGSRSAAKIGQSVQVGDTVDVPADGKLKLRLSDGSVVSVAAGSRMTVAAAGVDGTGQRQNVHLSLAQGLLRAVVAPVEHPASFEVDTAVGTAAVRSTDWFVEGSATAMQVGVLSGSVEMTSAATKRHETIPARWGARLEAGRDPVPPRVWSQAEFDAVIARTDVK
ncbi:MAG: FecR family protein [Stellaceae bacterium]